MDKPTPKERAEHILEAIKLIKEFVAGIDENTFIKDIKVQSAMQYQFLIIGEAIRYIDDAILAKYRFPGIYHGRSEILSYTYIME